MVEFAAIKADLAQWPDDVIREWLLPLANRGDDTGWRPPEPLVGAWKGILGGRPLSWWKNVTWRLEDYELRLQTLALRSRDIVSGMIDAHVYNIDNAYARMLNGKKRFLTAGGYLSETEPFRLRPWQYNERTA